MSNPWESGALVFDWAGRCMAGALFFNAWLDEVLALSFYPGFIIGRISWTG